MYEEGTDQQSVLSVTAAMSMAKGALENIVVTIEGEVSELSNKPGYKAVYFTIKDNSSALPCMMWQNRFAAAGIDIQIGSLVQLTGRFSLYMAKGRMNFDVFSISLAGEGKLRKLVADLAKKLQAEGLMDRSKKLPLPNMPEKIGLVTSPRGAAVHDVLRTLRRRYPVADVLLAGVPVEGKDAPKYLMQGIQTVIDNGAEVVLLVRGGGSFEDLMPFNDESLARYIASTGIPIVTGIGHEPDNSIADMVADLRTSTPTASAEAVAPSLLEIGAAIDSLKHRLSAAEVAEITRDRNALDRYAMHPIFREPERLFSNESQSLDDLSLRLSSSIPKTIDSSKAALTLASVSLKSSMARAFSGEASELVNMRTRMLGLGNTILNPYSSSMKLEASRLEDLSPLGVISRGYAICKDANGIVKSISQTDAGQYLSVTFSDGVLDCTVNSKDSIELSIDSLTESK